MTSAEIAMWCFWGMVAMLMRDDIEHFMKRWFADEEK